MSQDLLGNQKPHRLLDRVRHEQSGNATAHNQSSNSTGLSIRTTDDGGTSLRSDSLHGANTFDLMWGRALKNYEQSTGRHVWDEDQLNDLKSIESLMDKLDSRQRYFITWREKHGKLRSALSKMLPSIKRFGDVAQTALSLTPFAPAGVIFGGSSLLIDVCKILPRLRLAERDQGSSWSL